jgi:hypothetical protein
MRSATKTDGPGERSLRILGSSQQPSSVKLAQLSDARPYGEAGQRPVWVAQFDSLAVPSPDGTTSMTITLSLAFDAVTGDLVCAFTPPAAQWVRSTEACWDIQARQKWELSSARSELLRSTVTQVWTALWRMGSDPRQAGQIIIRPRFNATERFQPPSNVWVVEVLGKFHLRRYEHLFTTRVLVFRDGELNLVFGAFAP